MSLEILKHAVKTANFFAERRQRIRPILSANKKSASVAKHTRHVTNQARGSAHRSRDAEVTEFGGRIPQRFLCSVCQSRQEMAEQAAFVIHCDKSGGLT